MDEREMVSADEARKILDASPDLGAAVETGCGVLDNALTGGRQPFDLVIRAMDLLRDVERLARTVSRLRAEHAAALAAARREGAEEVMAMSNPWPLHDVLAKLTEASRALLNRYNYDGHGWELILAACESADAIIARIHARTRALPLDAPGGAT